MLELGNQRYNIIDKDQSVNDFDLDFINRSLGMFDYKRLPDTIPEDDAESILQINGAGIVTENKEDLIMLWGSWAPPYNCYYKPMNVLVNNPWADVDRTYKIQDDEEAVLIKNDPRCRGLMPIFNRAATMMTEAQITFYRALINFRAMFMFSGDEDADAKTADEFMKALEEGKSGKMLTAGFEKQIQAQPLLAQASNYITQSIEAQQYIIAKMFNEQIGLQSTFNMKRERQTANETQLDEDPLRPLIDAMLEERQRGWDRVNKKYGTDVEVSFKGVWSKYNANMATDGEGMPVENNEEVVEDERLQEGPETVEQGTETETSETVEEVNENDTTDTVVDEETDGTDAVETIEAVEEIVEDIKDIVEAVTDEPEDESLKYIEGGAEDES